MYFHFQRTGFEENLLSDLDNVGCVRHHICHHCHNCILTTNDLRVLEHHHLSLHLPIPDAPGADLTQRFHLVSRVSGLGEVHLHCLPLLNVQQPHRPSLHHSCGPLLVLLEYSKVSLTFQFLPVKLIKWKNHTL